MLSTVVRVRRPPSPTDALSADLSAEVDVEVLPGGGIIVGNGMSNELYSNDPIFLLALLGAMQDEVVRLEKENEWLRSTHQVKRRSSHNNHAQKSM